MTGKLLRKTVVFVFISICLIVVPANSFGWRHFPKRADFSRVVFVGDSLTAGFQSGSLSETGQKHGFAAVTAKQAEFNITLPLVSEPGIPPKLVLKDFDPLIIETAPGIGTRINPTEQATNLAVPGHTVNDALYRRPAADDPITSVVLGYPGAAVGLIKSQVEWAEALSPTFIFVWIGNNDVLGFATSGGTAPMTPLEDFEVDYQELLDRLEATGADLVMANIPDVTSIAFFVTAEQVAEQVGMDLAIIGQMLGIEKGDLVSIQGLPMVEKILTGQMSGQLPDEVVLDKAEIEITRQGVNSFNKIIAREAYRRNIPLVNINFLVKFVSIFGLSANGKLLNTQFLGGLFSLDGVHPTHTGYAVFANHFIRTLNFHYRTRIPMVNISEVAGNDPLVIPGILPDICDIRKTLTNRHSRSSELSF